MKRLAELSRTISKVAWRGHLGRAKLLHCLKSLHRLQRSNEYSLGNPFLVRRHVKAMVHTIREIDIRVSTFLEHDRIARRLATKGMAGRIVKTGIGFGLDNAADQLLAIDHAMQIAAEQTLCNSDAILLIKLPCKTLRRHHDANAGSV